MHDVLKSSFDSITRRVPCEVSCTLCATSSTYTMVNCHSSRAHRKGQLPSICNNGLPRTKWPGSCLEPSLEAGFVCPKELAYQSWVACSSANAGGMFIGLLANCSVSTYRHTYGRVPLGKSIMTSSSYCSTALVAMPSTFRLIAETRLCPD
jgi:hypothetical protein